MANPEHLKILKQGARAWNKWRIENPDIEPDPSGGRICGGADLSEADLHEAILSLDTSWYFAGFQISLLRINFYVRTSMSSTRAVCFDREIN